MQVRKMVLHLFGYFVVCVYEYLSSQNMYFSETVKITEQINYAYSFF